MLKSNQKTIHLFDAVANDDLKMVSEILYDKVETNKSFLSFLGRNKRETVSSFVNSYDSDGLAPMHKARSAQMMQLLIYHGADVDIIAKDGCFTPLYRALKNNDLKSAELLVKHGAKVNPDIGGFGTYFHCSHKPKTVRFLIEHGADVNYCDEGCNALFFAKSAEEMQLLLDAGADINRVDHRGRSALDCFNYEDPCYHVLEQAGCKTRVFQTEDFYVHFEKSGVTLDEAKEFVARYGTEKLLPYTCWNEDFEIVTIEKNKIINLCRHADSAEYLIMQGANIYGRNNWNKISAEVVDLLLNYGVDIDHFSLWHPDPRRLWVLLKHGAVVPVTNTGLSPAFIYARNYSDSSYFIHDEKNPHFWADEKMYKYIPERAEVLTVFGFEPSPVEKQIAEVIAKDDYVLTSDRNIALCVKKTDSGKYELQKNLIFTLESAKFWLSHGKSPEGIQYHFGISLFLTRCCYELLREGKLEPMPLEKFEDLTNDEKKKLIASVPASERIEILSKLPLKPTPINRHKSLIEQ